MKFDELYESLINEQAYLNIRHDSNTGHMTSVAGFRSDKSMYIQYAEKERKKVDKPNRDTFYSIVELGKRDSTYRTLFLFNPRTEEWEPAQEPNVYSDPRKYKFSDGKKYYEK